jgi:hypothetical protein
LKFPASSSLVWSCHDSPMVPPVGSDKTRPHPAPHSGQQPRSDVPASTHGSTSFSGNVAKWAPL